MRTYWERRTNGAKQEHAGTSGGAERMGEAGGMRAGPGTQGGWVKQEACGQVRGRRAVTRPCPGRPDVLPFPY